LRKVVDELVSVRQGSLDIGLIGKEDELSFVTIGGVAELMFKGLGLFLGEAGVEAEIALDS
jgi:hypothetical protein